MAQMKTFFKIQYWTVVFIVLITVSGYGQSDFTSDVKSAPYPWTHIRFLETGDNFNFAVITDRNNGCRAGIFDDAIQKLNLMRPSFVMSIGDFIRGYTDDESEIQREWAEVDSIIKKLDTPFFYVTGNHDYGEWAEPKAARGATKKLWHALRGPAYYYFIYKNTLFLCLNTMGDVSQDWSLGAEQLAWAKEILAKNKDVRWTFVFMHVPLWISKYTTPENGNENPHLFTELEKTLQNRNYTVFAGHTHQYAYYHRNGMKYFILATTGGSSQLRGPLCGEFDHMMWVSMTDSGPKFLNLELKGLLPEDISTDANTNFAAGVRFVPDTSTGQTKKNDFYFTFKNTLNVPVTMKAEWKNNSFWSIQPKTIDGTIQPGKNYFQSFHAELKGDRWTQLPELACQFQAGAFTSQWDITPPLNCNPVWTGFSRITVNRTTQPPTINGKLTDTVWKQTATINNLMYPDLSGPATPGTQVWLAYDDKNLYLACRCEEKDMKSLMAKVHQRDGDVWKDDCLEFFLDTNLDHKTYYQFDVNTLGTIYDATGFGNNSEKYNANNIQVAASRESGDWTVEMAIPWNDLNIQPPKSGTRMGYEISRLRPGKNDEGVFQFPPLGKAFNHQPELFGMLTFK
jgi:3',5'-cyclic AMP phosphodiesterase CpdA